MWLYQQSIIVDTSREQIWRQWADMPSWSKWDAAVERCYLNGEFKDGIGCLLKWRGLPLVFGVLRGCEPLRSFGVEGGFPLVSIRLWHELADGIDGVQVMRSVAISGPLGFLFARVLKRRALEGFPKAMARLSSVVKEEVGE